MRAVVSPIQVLILGHLQLLKEKNKELKRAYDRHVKSNSKKPNAFDDDGWDFDLKKKIDTL